MSDISVRVKKYEVYLLKIPRIDRTLLSNVLCWQISTFLENYVSLIISRVASSSAPYQMEPADSQTLVARYSDQPSYCVNRLHLSLYVDIYTFEADYKLESTLTRFNYHSLSIAFSNQLLIEKEFHMLRNVHCLNNLTQHKNKITQLIFFVRRSQKPHGSSLKNSHCKSELFPRTPIVGTSLRRAILSDLASPLCKPGLSQ